MRKNTVLSSSRLGLALALIALLLLTLPVTVGANESSAHISIRLYDGIDSTNKSEIGGIIEDGFIPIVSASEGFIAYYIVFSEADELVSINLFETREQALASNEAARGFVAESLAPHLPNPPKIIEGSLDIGFVEMLDGISESDVSALYAGLRIYDGLEANNLDAFVTSVEDGFLPIMRETDGFFGYYLMDDGADRVAAISIFDSEDSARTSNAAAADFVAENLTQYLPNDPSVAAGRVGIAVLADVNDGANLIDQRKFVSIRLYEGVDVTDRDDIVRIVDEGFLPIMRASDGFVAYYLLPGGDVLAAISLFDSVEQAAASNEAARGFVAEYMAPLLPNAPLIVEGSLDIAYVALREQMMDDSGMPLYASLRIYNVADMGHLEESNRLVEAYLLPALEEAGGLFSYYSLNDGDDTIAGLSVYDSEENALAANDIAAAFIAEHSSDILPDDPIRAYGPLGVAALAEIDMGVNQAEWEAMGG